jgi:NADPH:quinone reductase
MKAAVIYENGGPDVFRSADVPDRECPDGYVVIATEAISVEGGDLLARAGGELPSVPHIVGYQAALAHTPRAGRGGKVLFTLAR